MNTPFSEIIWEKLTGLWRGNHETKGDTLDYSDSRVRSLLRFMFRSRQSLQAMHPQKYDVGKAWEKVRTHTERPTSLKITLKVWKYAAILVLATGSMLYWTKYHSRPQPSLAGVYGDSILPGSRKAELILANGKHIALDGYHGVKEIQEMGIKLVSDSSAGKLHYEIAGGRDMRPLAYNTLNVPKGGEYSLILPDGSQVWLNAETSLRFPVRFAPDKREVFLEGEAFFHIRRDTSAPFKVYADGKEIEVLGTSFNVSAYDNDAFWETTLVTGKVSIAAGGQKVKMKPCEQYVVDRRTGEGRLKQVDPELYTSWVDGKFYFKAFPFEEIVKKLERWYDFSMVYGDDDIRRMRFSGTIDKHRPIEETLRYLEKTTHIRFQITGKQITVSKI